MAIYSILEDINGTQDGSSADGLIHLRSEQRDAIKRAKEHFCKKSGRKEEYAVLPEHRQFLWNAKMRFGKTICAMQLMRELDVKRTLIITHRPVVGNSWLDAFGQVVGTKNAGPKVEGNTDMHLAYGFGMRSDNESEGNFYDLEKFVETEGNHYAFFVSMQYIRLSELVNAKTLAKNKDKQEIPPGHFATNENEKLKADILNADWDLIIIDEAHEGTRTSLGKGVIDDFLKKDKTKMLYLSGTPFNLYEDFKEDEIYTWDYIAEQQAKSRWTLEHPGEKNPYAELPKMNIYTYDITRNIKNVLDQTGVFTFSEFFRTWTGNVKTDKAVMPDGAKGRFVHEADVEKFLELLCTKDAENNFPFSTTEYRQAFRHTLWVVSHVNEAAALEQLLNEHPIFKRFNVVNVAGKNDSDEQNENALDRVLKAIGELPEKTSTITISCGRLTTGVTVPPWTAVLYLKGGDRAATYMQTIFRVQSPYNTSDGRIKTECYVFDFAPDRTLKIVAETAKFSSMAKAKEKKRQEDEEEKTQEMRDKDTVRDFIELCPVISMEGGKMSPMDVNAIYKQLENVFIDRLVRKGFDDPCLYNQEELNRVNPDILNHIGENGGQAPDEKRKEAKNVVDLSHMTEEERAAWEEKIRRKKAEARKKAEEKVRKDEDFSRQWETWSEEEREEWLRQEAERIARREKAREEREEFRKRVTNIRGIALRIPLLMYGGADAGDTTEAITVDNFTRKIKDESWAEFMPKKVTKEDFNKIKKCFNATRFEEAGKRYRALTLEADFMHVDERISQITEIFSYFRNPDKETVLTPWRVVNMHMSDTLGGWCFYDETFDEKEGRLDEPRFVDRGDVTRQLFDNVDLAGEVQTRILEINSKTGLYPLYVTYSLYRRRLDEYIKAECIERESVSVQEEQVVWDDIVKDNIYVICNTPMAVGITRRTLFGFRDVERKANIKNVPLIKRASNDQGNLVKDLKSVGFWKGNTSKQEMKFNAVVGNPPYMLRDGSGASDDAANPIYQEFVRLAKHLDAIYVSLIIPSKWMIGGKAILKKFKKEMMDDFHISHIYDFENDREIFENAHNDGGICYFLRNKTYNEQGKVHFRFKNLNGEIITFFKTLKNEDSDIIVRDVQRESIISKAIVNNISISAIISKTKPFGIRKDLFNKPERYANAYTSDTPFDGSVLIYGVKGIKGGAKRTSAYINRQIITKNKEWIDQYKLLFTTSYSTNATVPPEDILSEPGTVCTETFIVIGPFQTKEEMNNCHKYLHTDLVRTLLYFGHGTMQVTASVFQFIPLQDFTSDSDIDWSQSIENINLQLYQKYKLQEEDIAFIEKTIKPME